MSDHVEMTDDELAEWRAEHPGRDRPNVVTGRAESKITSATGGIPIASDEPESE